MKDTQDDSQESPTKASSQPYSAPLPTMSRPPYFPAQPMYYIPGYGRQISTPMNQLQTIHGQERILSIQQGASVSIQEPVRYETIRNVYSLGNIHSKFDSNH